MAPIFDGNHGNAQSSAVAAGLPLGMTNGQHAGRPCAGQGLPAPGADGALAQARLLVIDDNTFILDSFRKILTNAGEIDSGSLDELEAALFASQPATKTSQPFFEVDFMQDGEQACQRVLQAKNAGQFYAMAFVDMRMPGGWDGLQTIEGLWRIDPDIQVVICTAFSDYSWDEITSRLGQSDRLLILRKPFEKIEVLQLASALSKKWALHREQHQAMETLEQRVFERTAALTQALAEREAYANQLQFQATHDILTGLANRNLLRDRLSQAIAHAVRLGHTIWVAFLDLDRFKVINDTLGHKAGDLLLNTMSTRLQSVLRETDTVARLGGDEFVMVMRSREDGGLSSTTLQRIMAVVAEPVWLSERTFSLTCSIGVAVYPLDGETPESLIEHADIAMYRAKENGRDNFQFFTAEMNQRLLERVQLEQALRQALERGQFVLHYQPQLDLRSGRIIGLEALIRWHHPELGVVAPARFIALAEECGLIVPIGAWVIRTACTQNKAWQDAGLAPVRVAVNLSVRQLMDVTLVDAIRQLLSESQLDPAYLEIEITESSVMADVEHSIAVLRRLKELGVQLSVDDFGTGYSSLSYLKRFPIDVLKIDQSFVREVESDPDNAAIVNSIISLAHSLRLHVIAEGVETATQLAYLQRQNCDLMQGYYFCRPLPAGEIEAMLRSGACLPGKAAGQAGCDAILIIDDDPATASLAVELERDGYCIFMAAAMARAFEILATHPVAVVICGQGMAAMDGIEFLSRIKSLYPQTLRIMLSAQAGSDNVIEVVNRASIHGYFVKPCDSITVLSGVRDAFIHYRERQQSGCADLCQPTTTMAATTVTG